MKRFTIISWLAALMALPAASAAEEIPLMPFSIDHRSADRSSLSLSFLQEGPAGERGPIRVAGGHLVKPDGARFRIWGVNLTDFAAGSIRFPAKPDAAFWADTLARFGVNCVRLHSFDGPAPKGIIDSGQNDTRSFDAEQLDRMDYFIAALKRRGIYVDLNLNVGRNYKAGDGVRDFELIGAAKALTYFDPRLIELQREYARKLLTHLNPYTNSEYRNEPAVAIVEILNENSLVGSWIRGRLMGTKTKGPPENWQDIPPSYAGQLTELYNQWLAAKLSPERLATLRQAAKVEPAASVPRLGPAEFAVASRERFEAEAEFYTETERGFFQSMQGYLKQTLGVKALLIGTSDYSYGRSFYPALSATATLDIVDAHGPWELAAMVDQPLNSIPVRASRSAVAGKPFIVSEHNHRFPSDYLSEGIPLLAAYAGFQDWDGIFLYTFELKPPGYSGRIETRADLSHDPVKLANLATSALMFLRADISPARETITRSYSRQQVLESLLLPASAAGVYFTPDFSPGLALQHEMRVASLSGPPTAPQAFAEKSPMVSDTRELSWYFSPGAGLATTEDDQKFVAASGSNRPAHSGAVVVDSPSTQVLVGFLNAREFHTAQLSADLKNTFASVMLASLDAKPIAQSSRLLLAATSRVSNYGAEWNAAHTGLAKWGGAPTVIEPVTGTIALNGLAGATAVFISPLDGAGRAMRLIAAQRAGDEWRLTLGDDVTTWFEITVERK